MSAVKGRRICDPILKSRHRSLSREGQEDRQFGRKSSFAPSARGRSCSTLFCKALESCGICQRNGLVAGDVRYSLFA